MKKQWLELKNRYWEPRSAQERSVIKYTSWLLLPVLAYMLLWQPVHAALEKLQANVPVLHRATEKLRIQAGEMERLRHLPKPALLDAFAMKVAVEESATRHGVREAITTLDLQQPNAVRISLASVSYAQWLHWLYALQQEQHIRADSLSVAALPQSGMVKINATLTNGGAQ